MGWGGVGGWVGVWGGTPTGIFVVKHGISCEHSRDSSPARTKGGRGSAGDAPSKALHCLSLDGRPARALRPPHIGAAGRKSLPGPACPFPFPWSAFVCPTTGNLSTQPSSGSSSLPAWAAIGLQVRPSPPRTLHAEVALLAQELQFAEQAALALALQNGRGCNTSKARW